MKHGNNYPGTLISVEGIDGAGKTTLVDHMADVARDCGYEVVTSKEPTRSWTGDIVYEALSKDDVDALTDFYLFCADRAYHTRQIREWLTDGKVVITDRYTDSTRAYQTHRIARELGIDYDEARSWMDDQFERWSVPTDLTIYVNIDVDTAMERCEGADKYETAPNLHIVKEAYDQLFSNCDHGVRVLDGTQPIPRVKQMAAAAVRTQLEDPVQNAFEGQKTYSEYANE